MKTLIIYGSTYGFTKECVFKLSKQLNGEVKTVNALTETIPSVKDYDNIIIGGSIYMGQIQKKIKEFCSANEKELLSKKIGLFLCCGVSESYELQVKNAFPEKLLNAAVAKECFGGELRIDRMKFFHKILTKMMLKAAEKNGTPPAAQLPENIKKLADIINK